MHPHLAESIPYLGVSTQPRPPAATGHRSNTFIHTRTDNPTPDMMVTFMAWCIGEGPKPRLFSAFTIHAAHIRPDARRRVRLTGPRPTEPTAIRFNFLESEANRLKHCRANGLSLLHGVGTCRMGPAGAAVVDPRPRMNCIGGLHVVDAAIMPRIVSGNTDTSCT